jgi:uncharacterized protein YjiK
MSAALILGNSACAEDTPESFEITGREYFAADRTQFKLPKVLREISGLALSDSGELFAHNDEDGIIYLVDYNQGKVVRRFALEGVAQADFEGIAVAGEELFLVTSRGEIYQTRIGAAEQMVPYQHHDERLDCEVEGLTHDATASALLVACKTLKKKHRADGLRLHVWSLERRAYDPARMVTIPYSALTAVADLGEDAGKKGNRIQPTGVTIAPNGNLLIVAGRQHLLLELSPEGSLISFARLDEARHRQTEGIAMTKDHRLILSDEGDGKGSNKSRGRLSVYKPAE